MSTTATEHTQIVLPGQAAAPAGEADMTMMYVMHHAFRRDLGRFATAVAETPLEDRATWKALAARWDRFFQILHHHHSAEDDLIWPYLVERADPAERATLDAMEDEHSEIDPMLVSVAEGLAALAGDRLPAGADDRRAALKVRMSATRDALARHLEHEETHAIAILQRHTGAEEWTRIEEGLRKRKLGVPMPFMVGWCAEDVPAKQLDEIFGIVGKPFKVLWLLTRRGFRRGEARAFKYVD